MKTGNHSNKKLFLFGWYDRRIFKGSWMDRKTPFAKTVDVYSMEELIKLPDFNWIVDTVNSSRIMKDWDDLDNEGKFEQILRHVQEDPMSQIIVFTEEEMAFQYKQSIHEEIEFIDSHSRLIGEEIDKYGYTRCVYAFRSKDEDW